MSALVAIIVMLVALPVVMFISVGESLRWMFHAAEKIEDTHGHVHRAFSAN